jgi:hypothetical protein
MAAPNDWREADKNLVVRQTSVGISGLLKRKVRKSDTLDCSARSAIQAFRRSGPLNLLA